LCPIVFFIGKGFHHHVCSSIEQKIQALFLNFVHALFTEMPSRTGRQEVGVKSTFQIEIMHET
jgi:hypothetical protein